MCFSFVKESNSYVDASCFFLMEVCFFSWAENIRTERGHAVNVMSKSARLLTHNKNVQVKIFLESTSQASEKCCFMKMPKVPKIQLNTANLKSSNSIGDLVGHHFRSDSIS